MTNKSPSAKAAPESGKKSRLRDYMESLIWAVLIALFIRTFVLQAFVIPSASMENTLLIGDHIFVNKFIYGIKVPFTDSRIWKIRDLKRGDVIVFEYPPNRSEDFIKRVIGVPGDVVMIRNKHVYVNGIPYHNPHAINKDPEVLPGSRSRRDNFGPIRVPADDYFVMGDNRDFSYDSRFWGFVPYKDIIGLAFIKYWSWYDSTWRIRWKDIGEPIH